MMRPGRVLRGGGDWLARRLAALAAAVAGGVRRLAYRRHELAIVALLAASLPAGLVVETWRRRAPTVLERVEGEPPRQTAAAAAAVSRARAGAAPRARGPARERAIGPVARAGPPVPRVEDRPLDVNRATADELARLRGIGPRLAARIVAQREALGGRFVSPHELATVRGLGARRAAALGARLARPGAPPAGERHVEPPAGDATAVPDSPP